MGIVLGYWVLGVMAFPRTTNCRSLARSPSRRNLCIPRGIHPSCQFWSQYPAWFSNHFRKHNKLYPIMTQLYHPRKKSENLSPGYLSCPIAEPSPQIPGCQAGLWEQTAQAEFPANHDPCRGLQYMRISNYKGS